MTDNQNFWKKKLAKLAKITNDKKTYLNETGIINIIKYSCKKQ